MNDNIDKELQAIENEPEPEALPRKFYDYAITEDCLTPCLCTYCMEDFLGLQFDDFCGECRD